MRSARSQSLSRPSRPADATSPRSTSIASIIRRFLVVVPPAGAPRDDAGVRQLAARQRTVHPQPVQDVEAAAVVGVHPVAQVLPPLRQRLESRPQRPSRRGRARGLRQAAPSLAARRAPACRAHPAAAPASTTTRAGSRARDPRSGRRPLWGRAAAASGAGRPRPGRWAAAPRAAAPARRPVARPAGTAAASRVEPTRRSRHRARPSLRALPSGARRLSRPPSPPVAGSGRCGRPG